MALIKGRSGKIVIAGSTMDYVSTASWNPGIEVEDVTHLQSTGREYFDMLKDGSLSFSGYVDFSDTAQNSLRASAEAEPTTLSGVVYYFDDDNYVTLPAEAIVSSYTPAQDAQGLVTFDAEIKANGAPVYTNA